uniref:Uncharacterized protein n=1 Tax=Cacopsylla melanoneura TaxID=428564 RepID=A0A8D8XBC7_9HEMI
MQKGNQENAKRLEDSSFSIAVDMLLRATSEYIIYKYKYTTPVNHCCNSNVINNVFSFQIRNLQPFHFSNSSAVKYVYQRHQCPLLRSYNSIYSINTLGYKFGTKYQNSRK